MFFYNNKKRTQLTYFTVSRTFRVFDTRARRHSGAKRRLPSIEYIIDALVFCVFTYLPIATNSLLQKEILYAIYYLAPVSEAQALVTGTAI